MFAVFRRAAGHRPELLAARDGAGGIEALMLPVRVTLLSRLPWLTSRCVVHGGVLYAPSAGGLRAAADLVREHARRQRHRALFTSIYHDRDGALEKALSGLTLRRERIATHRIDLHACEKEILRRMQKSTRKAIQRGLRRRDVDVTALTRVDELPAWYAVLERTYERARHPLPDISLFWSAFEVLHPAGKVRMLQASVGGRIAAVGAELLCRPVIQGWYGGTLREQDLNRCSPTEMLTWDILSWGSRNGYQLYDFGYTSLSRRQAGIRSFKTKFGGHTGLSWRTTVVHSPWLLPVSRFGYKLVGPSVVRRAF